MSLIDLRLAGSRRDAKIGVGGIFGLLNPLCAISLTICSDSQIVNPAWCNCTADQTKFFINFKIIFSQIGFDKIQVFDYFLRFLIEY